MPKVNLELLSLEHKAAKLAANKNKPLIIIEGDDGSPDVIFNMKSEKMVEWVGTRTSEMARDHKGRKLLKWMLTKNFDEEALEIISLQVDEHSI